MPYNQYGKVSSLIINLRLLFEGISLPKWHIVPSCCSSSNWAFFFNLAKSRWYHDTLSLLVQSIVQCISQKLTSSWTCSATIIIQIFMNCYCFYRRELTTYLLVLTMKWKSLHTFVLLNCLFPLYQVMIAGGLEPADSHTTSYLLSATSGFTALSIFAVKGFTITNYNVSIPRNKKLQISD